MTRRAVPRHGQRKRRLSPAAAGETSFRYRIETVEAIFERMKAARSQQRITRPAYTSMVEILRDEEIAISKEADAYAFKDLTESNYWHGHDTITFPTANGYACLNYPLTESTSTRYQPAPGIWTVRVSYNGALLRTLAAPILPAVNSGGVLNAASFAASGPIAQGSLFSIFGVGLGPAEGISNTTFPLSDTLGDVSIIAKQGAITAKVLPIYVSTGQINALLPSNTPLGDVQLVVTSNGTAGPPMSVAVGESNFGAFSINGTGQGPGVIQNYISDTEQPINTSSSTARPGQLVILWGTGLGAITAEENIPPPAGDLPAVVQVLVGGKTAVKYYSGRSPCCAAVDEIVFEVPPDAPEGCAVPVQVMTNSSLSSNTVTIAIQANGQHCEN